MISCLSGGWGFLLGTSCRKEKAEQGTKRFLLHREAFSAGGGAQSQDG